MQFSNKLKGFLILFAIVSTTPFLFIEGKTIEEGSLNLNADPKDWTVLVYMCGDNNA